MSDQPAFPCKLIREKNGFKETLTHPGMTLRDYFAAKAMQGLIQLDPTTAKQLCDPKGRNYQDWIASEAYEMADAMLKAREE